MPVRHLPDRPDVEQLRHQAKDLLREFRGGNPAAIADFADHHPERIAAATAKLADAQLVLARSYQCSSWPLLVGVCHAIASMTCEDFAALREVVTAHPSLLGRPTDSAQFGWRVAVTHAAQEAMVLIIERLSRNGFRNFDAVVADREQRHWLDTVRVLGRLGARFPRDAIGGALEVLDGSNIAFMVEIAGDIRDENGEWRSRAALTLETYARNPAGKHRILETMVDQGIPFPDTPTMAVHRGRLDLLEQHLVRDSRLLVRTFAHCDIWPSDLGCHADESLALHGVPLAGATLLHMAVDYEEIDVVRWLLDHGMDVNVRADVDADGFGGHTPLFNCVITWNAGHRDTSITTFLLDRGADPNAMASIRKGLAFAKDPSVHEYRDVTPVELARRFHEPSYVHKPSVKIIEERGGRAGERVN
ncbi:MAG: ankyrin repeat domain-containing protein [Gemmatimonadota bacterium]